MYTGYNIPVLTPHIRRLQFLLTLNQ